MKLKRTPPRTVFRAFSFPVYLLLVLQEGAEFPLPMVSQRDRRWGVHVEFTEAEALAAVQANQAMRQAHPTWYPTVRGSASMMVQDAADLRRLAAQITPAPEGLFYGLQYRRQGDHWEAIFVPWEKLHASQRAMG